MKFLEKYDNSKNVRFSCFKKTFDICLNRKLKTIVETGTARGKTKFFFLKKFNWKDGMSTPMFAEFVNYTNGTLHTCDISSKNIDNAKKFTKSFSNNIKYYVQDSLDFLKEFNKKIDLLYLDSLDGHDVQSSSEHQLNEIKIAINKLHDKSLILLDDKGSKTIKSVNYLLEKNYKIIFETDYQYLMSR